MERDPLVEASKSPLSSMGMGRSRYALGLLFVIYSVNHVDRQIMHILIEPVRLDLDLSDAQMGALVGAAFAIFYTFAGLPIARWADRGNRRNIIAAALAIWSVMTVASGMARGFLTLMAARIGVGVGEAGCTPPAHSLISDYFPAERRATALSTYALGVPMGTLLGLAFGGFLADQVGWRMAFFVVGAPGVLLALLTRFTLPEAQRGRNDSAADISVQPLREVLAFIWSLRSIRHVIIAASLQTLTLAGWGAWQATFLIRVHDLTLTQAGLALGLIAGVAGGLGTFGGGWLSDRLSARDPRWYLWLPALGALVSIPFSLVAFTTDSVALALCLLALASLGNHMYSAVGHAVVQSLVKPRMRAVMSAVALFGMNLLGFGVGPWAVGVISARLGGGEALREAMLFVSFFMLWACVHYVLAGRSYRIDLQAKNAT